MANKREKFGWAMYDFANSGYTTVILTAIYNTYFVSVIASEYETGLATLLWTITIGIANALVLLTAPLIGAIADYSNNKKKFLLATTFGCVFFTSLLFFTKQGDVALAVMLVILSSIMFYSGENLIAAFLPEISNESNIGKISGYGWALGYVGGLLVLMLCLVAVNWGQANNQTAEEYIPMTLLIVSLCFAVASIPTFVWLKERGSKTVKPAGQSYASIGFNRLKHTWNHAHQYKDLFRFLIALTVFYCGINTVIVLAAVYAQEVMNFETGDSIKLIIVVNITAAIGAFVFGLIQDRFGACRTQSMTLYLWIIAMLLAFFTSSEIMFWVVANIIGLALGASQSAGRTLIGLFSPENRHGEFYGLWGLAIKLSAIIGPMSYGFITFVTQGNHKIALLSTTLFFIAGLILLYRVNETRGKEAAKMDNISNQTNNKA